MPLTIADPLLRAKVRAYLDNMREAIATGQARNMLYALHTTYIRGGANAEDVLWNYIRTEMHPHTHMIEYLCHTLTSISADPSQWRDWAYLGQLAWIDRMLEDLETYGDPK